jgi:transglutaminase-like putative cysteine protease
MRASVVVRTILLFFAFSFPAFAFAQFQPPTAEELKMTADPKAPGAAAVYLYREETTDDMIHFHSYYERIKVLSEKGKELATVHIPYERGQFKVKGIRGRTIHADGTIIPLTAKPTDLVDVKAANYQFNTMVFTLPSVEVGSILEYRLDLDYDDSMVSSPTWKIQQPYFVHKAHYSFKTANLSSGSHYITDSQGHDLNQLLYAVISLPKETVVRDAAGKYSVDVTDIPPTPSDDWMPPLNAINERVEFYYSYAHSGTDFWTSEGKRWAKETGRFTNPNGQIKKVVADIVAPTDSDDQKARKIYAAVMKLENTDFTRKKTEAERKAEKLKAIKDAEDLWNQKTGSADEIAMLYVALARAAGLKAWPMEVVDRSRAIFDPSYLNVRQLDDYIAIVEIDGKDVYLDPGQKMCPYGIMSWKHQLASGFRLAEKGATLASTPNGNYRTAVVRHVANITIDSDGAANGTITVSMTGPDALRWRQLALENDPEEVKKQFNEYIRGEVPDGVQADLDHFSDLDNYTVDLQAIVKIEGHMGTATGKRFFLPGLFFESRGNHPFVGQEERTSPIDVQYPRMSVDNVTYHLPPGFAIESAPQTADLSWPNSAMLRIRSTAKENTIEVARAFANNYTVLEAKEYKDLRDFYLKVASADQQQIVLTRAPVAKGN